MLVEARSIVQPHTSIMPELYGTTWLIQQKVREELHGQLNGSIKQGNATERIRDGRRNY
jgi:hypothetical protein